VAVVVCHYIRNVVSIASSYRKSKGTNLISMSAREMRKAQKINLLRFSKQYRPPER
jgi:hypothetical protein